MVATRHLTIEEFEAMPLEGRWELERFSQELCGQGIATMAEPGGRIVRSDGGQAGGDGVLEGRAGAGSGLAQRGLELAKRLLDRREVGRVRWQEAHLTSRRFDELANGLVLVDTQVVPEHDLAGAQGRYQDLTGEQAPDLAIGRPGHRHRRGDARTTHGRDHRHVRPMVTGHDAHHALPAWRPPIARRQTQIGAALIDKDELGRIEVRRLGPPRRPRRLIALTGAQDFF